MSDGKFLHFDVNFHRKSIRQNFYKNVGHVLEVIYYRNEKFVFSFGFVDERNIILVFADERNIYFPTQKLKTSCCRHSFFFWRKKEKIKLGKIILPPCEIYTVLD